LPCKAGDFITAVSGRAADAACRLAALATSQPWSSDAILVSDAARQLLAGSHDLRPAGGGHLLLGSILPLNDGQQQPQEGRAGAGRWQSQIIGQQGRPRGSGAVQQAGQLAGAARRQMIRRKYEALELLLARGEGLQPAPEHLLTQPPPVGLMGGMG
jgi:hypothetical protein